MEVKCPKCGGVMHEEIVTVSGSESHRVRRVPMMVCQRCSLCLEGWEIEDELESVYWEEVNARLGRIKELL